MGSGTDCDPGGDGRLANEASQILLRGQETRLVRPIKNWISSLFLTIDDVQPISESHNLRTDHDERIGRQFATFHVCNKVV